MNLTLLFYAETRKVHVAHPDLYNIDHLKEAETWECPSS